MLEIGSLFGVATLLDADHGVGPGAVLRFELPAAGLAPGERSAPRLLRLRVAGADTLRPPEGAGTRGGAYPLVRLNVRVFAP